MKSILEYLKPKKTPPPTKTQMPLKLKLQLQKEAKDKGVTVASLLNLKLEEIKLIISKKQ